MLHLMMKILVCMKSLACGVCDSRGRKHINEKKYKLNI